MTTWGPLARREECWIGGTGTVSSPHDERSADAMNSDTEFARGETPFDPDDHTVVAAFADKETAQRAVKALHEEGFHKTWIGVTKADFEIDEANDSGIITTKVEDDSIAGRIGRFFSRGKGG